MAVCEENGAFFFLIPYSGGADNQFAQMWNWYGRGMVEKGRGVNRTRGMKVDDSEGTFPQTCHRRVIMNPLPRGVSEFQGEMISC